MNISYIRDKKINKQIKMETENEKKKEIQRLDKKIDKHLDIATVVGGAGIGTAAGTFGLACVGGTTGILTNTALEALLIPFIGGVAATGLAVIPLTIAVGYGIRKLIKKL